MKGHASDRSAHGSARPLICIICSETRWQNPYRKRIVERRLNGAVCDLRPAGSAAIQSGPRLFSQGLVNSRASAAGGFGVTSVPPCRSLFLWSVASARPATKTRRSRSMVEIGADRRERTGADTDGDGTEMGPDWEDEE